MPGTLTMGGDDDRPTLVEVLQIKLESRPDILVRQIDGLFGGFFIFCKKTTEVSLPVAGSINPASRIENARLKENACLVHFLI